MVGGSSARIEYVARGNILRHIEMRQRMSSHLTLEEATAVVATLANPSEFKHYSTRNEQEKLAFGIVILDRIMKGHTLRQIEQELQIPRATIARYRDKALMAVGTPVIEEARAQELRRLEELTEVLWPLCMAGDDKAMNTYLKVSEKRAALLGLNKPILVESTVTEITKEEAELQAMIAQAERDAAVEMDRVKTDD